MKWTGADHNAGFSLLELIVVVVSYCSEFASEWLAGC